MLTKITHQPDSLKREPDHHFLIVLPVLFIPPSDEEKRGKYGSPARKEERILKQGILKRQQR